MENENDIKIADTLSSSFYLSDDVWELSKDKIFGSSWQYLGDEDLLFNPEVNLHPIELLDGFISEPLILCRQSDSITCMSNVCTHRGFTLVNQPSKKRKITCGYHGSEYSETFDPLILVYLTPCG